MRGGRGRVCAGRGGGEESEDGTREELWWWSCRLRFRCLWARRTLFDWSRKDVRVLILPFGSFLREE